MHFQLLVCILHKLIQQLPALLAPHLLAPFGRPQKVGENKQLLVAIVVHSLFDFFNYC
jgi:hypothetical protein